MTVPNRLTAAGLALALALATPAFGQETAARDAPAADAPAAEAPPAETPETAPSDAAAVPTDAAPAPVQPEVLEIVRATHGAWEIRCEPQGQQCFLYQLARDADNNPVAEMSLVKLPEGSEAVAGITVVTPLGTFLVPGLGLQIDSGQTSRHEFTFCTQVGCFARFGVAADAIAAMKRGRVARLTVASVASPNEPVQLEVSLSGFTAGFDALTPVELPQQ
jgi:invasion protein IalB